MINYEEMMLQGGRGTEAGSYIEERERVGDEGSGEMDSDRKPSKNFSKGEGDGVEVAWRLTLVL